MAKKSTIPVESCPTTIWSEVRDAGSGNPASARVALESLLTKYYGPLRAHLVFKFGANPDEAADWLHSFVLEKVLLEQLIARANQERGRFRNFLLSALDNYVVSQKRHNRTRSRRPQGGFEALESLSRPEEAQASEAAADPFDLEWVRTVMEETLSRMEGQCEAKGCPERWQVFRLRILEPVLQDAQPEPYDRLVARLALRSPAEASSALLTAKRMFSQILREVIREYAGDARHTEMEFKAFKEILTQAA